MEYYEDRRIVAGLGKDELIEKLPLKGRRKTCSIRVALHYDQTMHLSQKSRSSTQTHDMALNGFRHYLVPPARNSPKPL
eukprot:7922775-Pyramimonas_sp.AAC.1